MLVVDGSACWRWRENVYNLMLLLTNLHLLYIEQYVYERKRRDFDKFPVVCSVVCYNYWSVVLDAFKGNTKYLWWKCSVLGLSPFVEYSIYYHIHCVFWKWREEKERLKRCYRVAQFILIHVGTRTICMVVGSPHHFRQGLSRRKFMWALACENINFWGFLTKNNRLPWNISLVESNSVRLVSFRCDEGYHNRLYRSQWSGDFDSSLYAACSVHCRLHRK